MGLDLGAPRFALINLSVKPLSLLLAFEATDPDVEILFLFPRETSYNYHPLRNLERDQDFIHEFHPPFHFSFLDPVLTQLEKHDVLLSDFVTAVF